MNVPEPMPSIENVAGVPAGVLKASPQQPGTPIRVVSESKVKVKAAELNDCAPTMPLPVPEKVMVSGSAVASVASSKAAHNNWQDVFIFECLLGGVWPPNCVNLKVHDRRGVGS